MSVSSGWVCSGWGSAVDECQQCLYRRERLGRLSRPPSLPAADLWNRPGGLCSRLSGTSGLPARSSEVGVKMLNAECVGSDTASGYCWKGMSSFVPSLFKHGILQCFLAFIFFIIIIFKNLSSHIIISPWYFPYLHIRCVKQVVVGPVAHHVSGFWPLRWIYIICLFFIFIFLMHQMTFPISFVSFELYLKYYAIFFLFCLW